jgi:transcriptional regulator with XRE-family HTH domain
MSQAELAKSADINLRQVRRYESDEQQPAIGVAVRLANALGITIGELAGETSTIPQLTGEWWAAWQTYIDGVETITTQPVAIQQTGATLQLKALALAEDEHPGDYLWRGELRLWAPTPSWAGTSPPTRTSDPYDVPNVTAIPLVAGNSDYFAWIDAETSAREPTP